jgi:hypothetical protein
MFLKDWITPDELLAGHPGFGYCELDVEKLVGLGFRVVYQPDEGGPAHFGVHGTLDKKMQQTLVTLCRVVQAPGPPRLVG